MVVAFNSCFYTNATQPPLKEKKDSRREAVVVVVARPLGELALESSELPGLAVFIRGWGRTGVLGNRANPAGAAKRVAPVVAMMMGFEAGQVSKFDATGKSQD